MEIRKRQAKKTSCASVTWQNPWISLGQGSFKFFGLGIQRNLHLISSRYYIYFLLRTQLTSMIEGQPSKARPVFNQKAKVIDGF